MEGLQHAQVHQRTQGFQSANPSPLTLARLFLLQTPPFLFVSNLRAPKNLSQPTSGQAQGRARRCRPRYPVHTPQPYKHGNNITLHTLLLHTHSTTLPCPHRHATLSNKRATKVQSLWRGILARHHFARIKASIVLQKNWRGRQDRIFVKRLRAVIRLQIGFGQAAPLSLSRTISSTTLVRFVSPRDALI